MTDDAGFEVELRFSDRPPRRVMVTARCTFLNLPLWSGGYLQFSDSGKKTEDGAEIWTPVVRH